MSQDPPERTVCIPVRVVGGTLVPFYGGQWPPLAEGTIGDLILPARALLNPQDQLLLSARLEIPLLPKGAELLIGVSPEARHPAVERLSNEVDLDGAERTFVRLRLSEELRLEMRGTKKSRLCACKCSLPALKQEADSVNEAYTIASHAVELKRRSHTGNVFTKVFYEDSPANSRIERWRPLDRLRDHAEALLESRFGQPIRQVKEGTSEHGSR